jgi:CubicO group peptidase (beta-lactamase class C family)
LIAQSRFERITYHTSEFPTAPGVHLFKTFLAGVFLTEKGFKRKPQIGMIFRKLFEVIKEKDMQLHETVKCTACKILTLLLSAIILTSYTAASTDYLPKENWQGTAPEEQGMQSQKLADMMEVIKQNQYNIDSILIIRNGYMVLDAYFYPFSKGQRHPIRSCTKSIMSALIGIAIDKGYIQSVDQPITDFFPNKSIANMDEYKKSITLEHLLMMASGLDCKDSYLYNWMGLFEMKCSDDWAQYVLDLPMVGPPGESFEYCNGVSYLLSVIIQNVTKMNTLEFGQKHLFNPLGISEIVWERSPQGVDIGYGEMWLKPHDMAKIGWLYLNKGRWVDEQIVSSSWVQTSTRGHIESKPVPQYGYHWWVNNDGNYAAAGHKGQFILVAPYMNMVVVFTADLTGHTFFIPLELMREYIIPAVSSSNPLPRNAKESERLDKLVKSVTSPYTDGFVWLSKQEGVAKDGRFRHTVSPRFQFEFPVESQKLSTLSQWQVMRMKTPDEVHFDASVIAIPEKIELQDFGPRFYSKYLQKVGSEVKVVANRKIILNCGTPAFRTDIKWVYNNFLEVTSLVVSSYKENRCVYLAIHPGTAPDKYAPIVESLTFEQ